MANLNIEPQAVLLTSGQAATFTATDAAGQPVTVKWSLSPSMGSLTTPPADTPAASATYIAPAIGATVQTIALVASTPTNSASATISLTPDAISIVPAKVDLSCDQSQQFIAIVAGSHAAAGAPTQPGPPGAAAAPPQPGQPKENEAAAEKITWILSPPVGNLTQTGWYEAKYEAPGEIPDSMTVNVIAASPTLAKQAVATVSLASPPWTGRGVQMLGAYLLLVFSLVFLMVGLWPPELPSPDAAKANRIEAEKAVIQAEKTADEAEKTWEDKTAALNAEKKKASAPAIGPTGPAAASANPTSLEEAQANAEAARYVLQQAQDARQSALKDLSKKQDDEKKVNDSAVETKLAGHIDRELDLLWLVLLAGALGSFLHVAQSYSDYVGNRTLKSSWASWYCFRPFIGAGLALVVYAAGRGGVMAIASGSNAKASELNPFGLVAVAALVGMFSKAATTKLGEVFDTLFKSDLPNKSKDPLVQSSQASVPSAGSTSGGAAASAAKK